MTHPGTGQRELLALHGLSPFIYRVGFLISELTLSMVMAFAICMFSLILRVMGPVESLVSFIDLFVIIVVFCISSCSLMMAMSPFFRKPMTAAMVIFILYFGSIFSFSSRVARTKRSFMITWAEIYFITLRRRFAATFILVTNPCTPECGT